MYGIGTLYIDLYMYLNPRNSFQQNRIILPTYMYFLKIMSFQKKNLLVNCTPHDAKGYNVHL